MSAHEVLTVLPLFEDEYRSVARVVLDGINASMRNSVCHMRYEVVCGEGVMVIDGEWHELRPGTIVEVKPGQAYQDAGRLSMIATAEPPFYPEQAEFSEQQLPVCFSEEITQASQANELVV